MPIYMKYEGIDGDVTVAGHENWIELQSFSWGTGREGGLQQHNRGCGAENRCTPLAEDMTFLKRLDKASPILALACATGQHFGQGTMPVQISVLKPRAPKAEFYTIKLSDVLISSYQVAGSGDSAPTDSFSLNFAKISFSFQPTDAKGMPMGAPVASGFDIFIK